jgi:hypothetical protein
MKTTNQKTEYIALSDLYMDGYQRPTSTKQVNDICANFDESKLGFLTVSHRDRKYYILDGAHRATVMRKLGYTHASCLVLEGLSYEEEAEYFLTQNENRRRLSQYDLFNAGLQAKEEICVKIAEVLEKNGFSVGNRVKNFNEIKAIFALKTVASVYGFETLDTVLRLIRRTWDGVNIATNREFLVGIAEFVKYFGERDFINRLKDKPVFAMWQEYLRISGQYANRASDAPDIRKMFCRVLVDFYNRGLTRRSRNYLNYEVTI